VKNGELSRGSSIRSCGFDEMKTSEKIDKIIYELEDPQERIALVKSIDSADELYTLLDHYNWDDGFEIPMVIADHSECDLAIAIKLYWLSEADYWYESDEEVDQFSKSHYEFSRLITERLLSGYYEIGKLSHSENFNRVQIYKFKKQGYPEILYTPVIGNET